MSINNEKAAPGATGSGFRFGSVNSGCGSLNLFGVNRPKTVVRQAPPRENPAPPSVFDTTNPDALTVLKTGRELLTKRLRADGEWVPYDHARWFVGHVVDVSNDDLLIALLRKLESRPRCAIVHGAIAPGVFRFNMLRRSVTPPITLIDTPRFVFGLDVDTIACQPGLDPRELELCAAYVRSLLPPAFRNVRCIAVATSGHCLKDGLRFRAWFRFSRPITCAELKRWLQREHAPVDTKPLHAEGLTYGRPKVPKPRRQSASEWPAGRAGRRTVRNRAGSHGAEAAAYRAAKGLPRGA